MKLAIMQPYFFPYLGYFSLIKQADEFIIFDTPQYIRHGWIERNRILKLDGEALYIKVALQKHKRETAIKNIFINNEVAWQAKIKAQLDSYKKTAPHYPQVMEMLDQILSKQHVSIVNLNFEILSTICDFLEIKTPIKIWSKMKVDIEEANAPDEWALNICRTLKADTYFNPIGGMSFFDRNKYKSTGIDIKFVEFIPTSYYQLGNDFVPNLSIIDVLMFNDKDSVRLMLENINYLD